MRYEDLDESENIEDRRTRTDPPAYGLDENDTVLRTRERSDDPEQTVGPMFDELQDRIDQQYLRRQAKRSQIGFAHGGAVENYEDGGPVDAADEYAALGDFEDSTGSDVNAALRAVNEALMYGRKKYGLLGRQKQNFADGGAVEETDWDSLHAQILPEGSEFPQDSVTSVLDLPTEDIPFEGPERPTDNRFERAFSENVAQPVQQFGRRILGYLQSAEADPQLSRRAEMEVDPEGVLDEDTRKLLAVQLAQQRGGPEASWRVLQDYRKKYDGYRAFAAAALQNQDLQSATRAASQAYPNILDGTSISFAPGQEGVVATVRPRQGEPQQLQLTLEQFNRWLTGDEGQYDMVLARGGPAQLQALLTAQAQPAQPGVTAQPAGGTPTSAAPAMRAPVASRLPPTDESDIRPFAVPSVAARYPNRYRPTPKGYESPVVPAETEEDRLLREAYPWASQGEERARAKLTGREKAEQLKQRYVEPAQLRAETSQANTQARVQGQRDVAEIRGAAYDARTQRVYEAAMARVQQQAQRGQNTDQLRRESNAMRAIVEKLRNNMELTPQERQVHERIMQGAQGEAGPPAQPPRSGQPQQRGQAPAASARPPGAAFRDQQGRFYDKFGRPL